MAQRGLKFAASQVSFSIGDMFEWVKSVLYPSEMSKPCSALPCQNAIMEEAKHIQQDLAYIKQRFLRSPSQTRFRNRTNSFGLTTTRYEDAPEFLRHNADIRTGYRTFTTKEKCIRGIFRWNNETMNIWTNLVAMAWLGYLFGEDLVFRHDHLESSEWDRKLSSTMLFTYLAMLVCSTMFHVFNCCCEPCYRYWYGWDVIGICMSVYGYGAGFVMMQFRPFPFWMATYFLAKTILIAIPIFMVVHDKYCGADYDDQRSRWIGVFVAFSIIPLVHFIHLHGGWNSVVVQATIGGHLCVLALLVGSYIIYSTRYPEKLFPGFVDYVGSSHQIWHIGVSLAVFEARKLYFDYVQVYAQLGCREGPIC